MSSTFDQAKDTVEQVAGQAKEKVGEALGNDQLQDSGKADQFSGEATEADRDLTDQAGTAAKDPKDNLTGAGQ